jgi:hypothetical protein
VEQAEHSHILQTLQQTEGVIGGRNGTAARLSLPRTTSIHKRLGISSSELHSEAGRVCMLAEAEREHISEVVEMTNGLIAGKSGAANLLGLPLSTLLFETAWRSLASSSSLKGGSMPRIQTRRNATRTRGLARMARIYQSSIKCLAMAQKTFEPQKVSPVDSGKLLLRYANFTVMC